MKMAKRILSILMAVMMVLSCWVWVEPSAVASNTANAAEAAKDKYLFAYFTGTSKEGQTIHLAVSEDGYNYTALRGNEPVIIPSKGVGNVRDPYIWYNEQDNYYYILATDLDFTDGGGTYSTNSQSFIIWRSKDLIHWYDETMIDVSKMAHLIGDTRNMSAVWAPQVLWDGSAYVVYFTLACNATSWFDIVYLKTTDLMDPNAYYEFDYILGNGTGNGTDNGYGVIDADIIHNPGNGKYYLFYKVENHDKNLGTDSNNSDEALRKIFYYVGDTPTGPFTNPGDTLTNWTNAGYSLWPDAGYSLEGCNAFWDNAGNLIVYADEYAHTNYYSGEAEAYFRIAKSNGYDFTSWTYPDVSEHNINSLSPRHGSVVKITQEEYERLLKNSYLISSSSYPATEVLEDHLVAQYFTTADVKWNNVLGQPNLASATGITMVEDPSIGYYAEFDSTNGGWAEVDFASLFRKTNGLNYDDGFTITFNALLHPITNANNENNDRIYEIADVFGSRTGTEHYTHFSPGGGGNGSYLGNYNGPVDSGNDWLNDKDGSNRDDDKFHEYIISYATGNVMVYVDGELVISRNRFTGVNLDDAWYKALGSNATMRIGKSGWDADPLFKGRIQNLCIYDCSMSYYDAQSMYDAYKDDLGWVEKDEYTGITSAVPTFSNSNASQMETHRDTHFSNILYSEPVTGTPSGTGETANPTHGDVIGSAATYMEKGEMKMGIYYSPLTVVLLDGKNQALIPVEIAGRSNSKDSDDYFYQAYPSNGTSTADCPEVKMVSKWSGWNSSDQYHHTIATAEDGYFGHNASTSEKGPKLDHSKDWAGVEYQSTRKVCFFAGTMYIDEANINFGTNYYKKINLFWRIAGDNDGTWFNDVIFSDHDIYVIDFRPVLELRETITKAAYDAVMNDSRLCPALREKYAAAVYSIRTLDPNNFGFDTAPVTATNALGKAIREAVNTYKGVMAEIAREEAAGSYGHQCSEFEAREATCTQNGLTEGSYCAICGEILKEQEIIAPLPHSFGDIITEDGIQYKKCSVCGIKIEYQASEVRYENLFALNRWVNSTSNNVFSGTISNNLTNGTITIVNQNTDEMYTRSTYDGTNLAATRDFTCYCIPVTGGKSYVVEATSLASSTSGGDVFVFQYTKDGLAYSAIPAVIGGLTPGATSHAAFTVDANAAYIELRFDANDAGKTITFSNIGVYTEASWKKFAVDTAEARLGFYPGDNKKLVYPNPGDGYSFDGWYTYSGIRVENVNQLNNPSTVVYGKWIPAGLDLTYDSIFSFSSWAKSSCNQLWYGDQKNADGSVTRLVSDEGIVADAANGTITIYNDEDTTYFARTNYWANSGNVYKSTLKENTEYILEYTVTSDDGGKPSVCLYITGGTAQYPETGNATRYAMGTHYFRFDSGNNTKLTLRFDNVQHGSTVTFSDIAVYEASFEEAARTIENREYRRYYPMTMGFGDIFEYTPVRPGFTFETWMADLDGDGVHDGYDCKALDDTALVEQNWHVFSTWTENTYNIAYNANGGTGTVTEQTTKYTNDVALATSGFTKVGYELIGWSTIPNATSAQYQLGQTTNRLVGEKDGTITLYAVWKAKLINVTFDNLIDFGNWNKDSASNATISNVTGNGFTLTSNDGVGEGTSSSPFFPVEPSKQYKIDIDFIGDNWDVYIFFCNESGGWVDFADSTNRYSSNGSTGISKDNAVFTAPNKSEVVKAQIRVDANGSNNAVTFNNIRVYELGCEIPDGVSYELPVSFTYDQTYGTLPEPVRTGYSFVGWFTADNRLITEEDTVREISDFALYSKWVVSTVVVDFDAPVTINPFDSKDSNFFTLDSITANGSAGTFNKADQAITYIPGKMLSTADEASYDISFNGNKKSFVLNVAPASNMLFEEDRFTVTNETGNSWTTVGTATNAAQSVSDKNDVYGYDKAYDNTDTYSGGSALEVTVDSTTKRGQIMSFDFTGTGFDLYGQCASDSAVMVVTVKNNVTNAMVKAFVVDTYFNDSTYGILNQVPILSMRDLEYGSYTIQVSAMYLASAQALQGATAQSVYGLRDVTAYYAPMSSAEMLYTALEEVGLEYIFEADDLEVVWFDEGSVFAGGMGASTYSLNDDTQEVVTRTVPTKLRSVVDAVRVYNPADCYGINDYYIAHELGAKYYNIMDNLKNGTLVTGDGTVTYVTYTPDKTDVDFATYETKGSNEEFYLIHDGKTALVFNIAQVAFGGRIMVSFRAASGNPVAKIGEGQQAITSATEMYYDITDYIASDGTVTIQNVGDGLLAIGNIKSTNTVAPIMMSTFNLRTARMMMAAPAEDVEFNAPEEEPEIIVPDEPETEEPSTEIPEVPSDDADEEEKSFIDKIYDLIDFIVYLVKKLFSTLDFMKTL